MHLINNKAGINNDRIKIDALEIRGLRTGDETLSHRDIRVGGYYLYKEKFGMVALVKVLENTSKGDWTGFRLKIRRVFHSPWPTPKGFIFETGFCSGTIKEPGAWHFESGMTLIKCDMKLNDVKSSGFEIESAL